MRRRILNEDNKISWQPKHKQVNNKAKKVVYIITKWGGVELGEYDDFWDAVLDAEDEYCMEANMIDAYYVTFDDDGLASYDPVPEGEPYYAHWTEEEGVIVEPTQSYDEHQETSLSEASIFPSYDDLKTSWVTRAPQTNNSVTTQNKTTNNSATSSTNTSAGSQPLPGNFCVKPLDSAEKAALNAAASNADRVQYALVLLKIFMDRLAPKFGLSINNPGVADFYDINAGGLKDLCADADTNEAWPTIAEVAAHFNQVVKRPMTTFEKVFMEASLKVLSELAPDSYCEVFHNASAFYDLRATNWLDSVCDYSDYEYAFDMGWAGNPEEDWTGMMGQYNHAGEYLEEAYAFGEASGAWFKAVCG